MARLTVLQFPEEPEPFDIAGSAVTPEVGGDDFPNDQRTGFWVDNQNGGDVSVTFVPTRDCDQGFQHAAVVVVPDGFTGFIASRLFHARFGQPDGTVQVLYSATTGVLVAAVRLL